MERILDVGGCTRVHQACLAVLPAFMKHNLLAGESNTGNVECLMREPRND